MLLETSDLTKRFGAITANDRVDLSVERGEIRGIIGPNGAGKSTLFNVITGFHEPDAGTINFDGTDITGLSPAEVTQEGLCRTFQITSPLEDMNVYKNLLAAYTPGFRIPEWKRERADEILELLEIEHERETKAGDLSGGQQKLLELGRVLMLEPECIMLDEPTAGVNPALQERILEYLGHANESGTTLIIIEHDMKVISEITDTVTVFDQGSIIVEGPFNEVKNDPQVREAYLGSDTDGMEALI
ncbi:ABC transporter ATP-binding protein (plasmid) [Natrinema zhouii]|uniref:ABC transporter ATP-binding protein n=1 Tax=Natrinema zhouii TaxID=1710539 RepID=UPI001CFF8767|nr:ABC transporter ATP-binding protein [Natrinema zhouii]UHQ98848.1 ABC transporter ATP-binding protein [Natrinema zhouii]